MKFRSGAFATMTLTTAFAACSVPAAGIAAKDCARPGIESGSAIPQNLGRGFVGAEGGYGVPEGEGSYFDVTDCQSGNEIRLTAFRDHQGGDVRPLRSDKREAVADIRARLASDGVRSLDDLAAMAAAATVITQASQSNKQTCGCRAFYPELQGDKEPYPEQAT